MSTSKKPRFPPNLKFGDWLVSPADKSVSWRRTSRKAIFVEYLGAHSVRAVSADDKNITVLFAYDEWKKTRKPSKV